MSTLLENRQCNFLFHQQVMRNNLVTIHKSFQVGLISLSHEIAVNKLLDFLHCVNDTNSLDSR